MAKLRSSPAREQMRSHIEFDRAPSALRYMSGAILRGERTTPLDASVSARWRECRVSARDLQRFQALTNIQRHDHTPLLLVQMLAFRLNMAVLTCPHFPLPIWRALQVRNATTLHAPMLADHSYSVETTTSDRRVLEKGIEIDLRTTFVSGATLFWEGTNTFYYRGRYGPPQQPRAAMATSPAAPTRVAAHWDGPRGDGLAVARLTGDYNGVHLWDAYARLFGFPGAFIHPPLLAALCLARLADVSAVPQQLRLWIKGQVRYGARLRLRADESPGQATFALYSDHDPRPAMLGEWRAGTSGP